MEENVTDHDEEGVEPSTYMIDLGTSSLGNPGHSAWVAAFVQPDGTSFEREGVHAETTSPQITLRGLLAILLELPRDAEATVRLRDKNTVESLNGRLVTWEGNGWRKADRKPVANHDLWMRIAGAWKERPGIVFEWANVPGSVGTAMETKAERLARATKKAAGQ